MCFMELIFHLHPLVDSYYFQFLFISHLFNSLLVNFLNISKLFLLGFNQLQIIQYNYLFKIHISIILFFSSYPQIPHRAYSYKSYFPFHLRPLYLFNFILSIFLLITTYRMIIPLQNSLVLFLILPYQADWIIQPSRYNQSILSNHPATYPHLHRPIKIIAFLLLFFFNQCID